MPDLLNQIRMQMAELQEQNLLRKRRIVDGPQGPLLVVDGCEYLAFCNNDYLGLANHPALHAAAQAGLEKYGVGASASALISGHTRVGEELEQTLADFVGMPRALHFSSGYMANIGTIPALVGVGDVVFSDRFNHACLIDGARLSGAKFRIYPHNDVARLEQLLAKSTHRRKLVVTDAIFSMDGDIAPLPELLSLCEKYDAWLLIDDAHGFGIMGPQGRGSVAHFGLKSKRILYMGTLGKAAGIAGAFVAGDAILIEWLLQRARTYIFTTASPPLLASALLAAIQLIQTENWRQQHLQQLICRFRNGIANLPWPLLPSVTAVQALIIKNNQLALDLMEGLREQGIWVPAIRPPTVPKNMARLRISLSAMHSNDQVDQLIKALHRLAKTHANAEMITRSTVE